MEDRSEPCYITFAIKDADGAEVAHVRLLEPCTERDAVNAYYLLNAAHKHVEPWLVDRMRDMLASMPFAELIAIHLAEGLLYLYIGKVEESVEAAGELGLFNAFGAAQALPPHFEIKRIGPDEQQVTVDVSGIDPEVITPRLKRIVDNALNQEDGAGLEENAIWIADHIVAWQLLEMTEEYGERLDSFTDEEWDRVFVDGFCKNLQTSISDALEILRYDLVESFLVHIDKDCSLEEISEILGLPSANPATDGVAELDLLMQHVEAPERVIETLRCFPSEILQIAATAAKERELSVKLERLGLEKGQIGDFLTAVFGYSMGFSTQDRTDGEDLKRVLQHRNNELRNAHNIIKQQKRKNVSLEKRHKGMPSVDKMISLIDEHRFKSSGKANCSALGRQLGVDSETVKSWIQKLGLFNYAFEISD